jgi:hypothetical protein
MAESRRYYDNSGESDNIAEIVELLDIKEATPRRSLSPGAKKVIGASLATVAAVSVGYWWGTRDASDPSNRPQAGSGAGAVVDVDPTEKSPTIPTPRSGDFGRTILECTSIIITQIDHDTYRYAPAVTMAPNGRVDAPHLYTLGAYIDNKTGDTKTTATKGISPVTMSFSTGTPVVLGLADFSQAANKPTGPEDVPQPESVEMIMDPNIAVYPCPVENLGDPNDPIYHINRK